MLEMRPDKGEIIKDLVLGRRTIGDIAKRCGVHPMTVRRFREDKITEEMQRSVMAQHRIEGVEADTDIINHDRLDISNTYESLAKRVEKLITKAEANDDDAFALTAMEGLRKVLRDIAQMQGKLATALTVQITLSESKEWITLRGILEELCNELPEAKPILLQKMRHHVLSVTKENDFAI